MWISSNAEVDLIVLDEKIVPKWCKNNDKKNKIVSIVSR